MTHRVDPSPNSLDWQLAADSYVRQIRGFLPQQKWEGVLSAFPGGSSLPADQLTAIARRVWAFMVITPGPWPLSELIAAGKRVNHLQIVAPKGLRS